MNRIDCNGEIFAVDTITGAYGYLVAVLCRLGASGKALSTLEFLYKEAYRDGYLDHANKKKCKYAEKIK
jgi:hypothetical protein